MALPQLVRRRAESKIGALCERRIPPHIRDQIKLEFTIRGDSITIVERRPPWRSDIGPEWTTMKIAQLRFQTGSGTWSLWWSDRNGRWLRVPDLDASPDIEQLLAVIDDDPSGAFWG